MMSSEPIADAGQAKATAKAAAKAAAKVERLAKAAAKAEALKAAAAAAAENQPAGVIRNPEKKRKTIEKEHTAFAELLATVKKRNNSVRAIATPDGHDKSSVSDMDNHIVVLTEMKDKLEGMATASVPETPDAMEVVMLEKDTLIKKIESEVQYQKDRLKRMQAPKALGRPHGSLASESEPLVQ